LRRKVRKKLGIPFSERPFAHVYSDVDYGVLARHGHEYDEFNYEGGPSYEHEDYMRVPIGDAVTTELVARLPWRIMKRAAIKKLPKEQRDRLRRNLQEIENVRPFSAILEWLLYQVKTNPTIKESIEDSVDDIISEFNGLNFVKRWYSHHDKWHDFMDEADKIQAVLYLLEKFKIFPSERWMPYLEKIKRRFEKDDLLKAAKEEYAGLDDRIRYVVYGHSHMPVQVPIRVIETPDGPKQYVYLNTGTWRTLYRRCRQGLGFIGWKNLTYTVFYRREERGSDVPAFETWTGTLKTV